MTQHGYVDLHCNLIELYQVYNGTMRPTYVKDPIPLCRRKQKQLKLRPHLCCLQNKVTYCDVTFASRAIRCRFRAKSDVERGTVQGLFFVRPIDFRFVVLQNFTDHLIYKIQSLFVCLSVSLFVCSLWKKN